MLKTMKNGDKVVTTSGILGTIIGIKDNTVSLRSADAKLEVLKSSVTEIKERGSSEA
ncbi:preprotein translocase subunit YajC [compost metagenome]